MQRILVRCRQCQKDIEFEVPRQGLEDWRSGVLIQDALPTLTSDQRELLISAICGPCFDKLFSEED